MQRAEFRFAPVVLALLALLVPAALFAAPPIVPGGDWTLSGKHSEKGTYTGQVTITRAADGTYQVSQTLVFGANDQETWTGTGRMVASAFKTELTRSTGSVIGHLDDPATAAGTELIRGTYGLSRNKQVLTGSWASSTKPSRKGKEIMRIGAPGSNKVDLAVIRPDGSELTEDKEETVGEAISVNLDDDDHDGGKGGHAQNNIVSDMDDQNGVAGEDDMLALKVKKVANPPAGAVLRLEFPDAKIGMYRNADHTGRATGGSLDLPADKESMVYMEGRAASEGGAPEIVSLKLLQSGKSLGEDKVKIYVTRSAFLLLGHGNSGSWTLESYLSSHKKDSRSNPTIVPGKDKNGKATFWSVYVWDTEKQAKLALSNPGAVIAYDGHSNFGMGYAFETGFKTVSEFMNIADDQVPVNWLYLREHQEHPGLVFSDAEYADDSTTTEKADPVQVGGFNIKGKHGTYDHARFPLNGGSGMRMHLTRGSKKWLDYHYSMGMDEGQPNNRIVIKAGSADMPAKKWDALFLNSCYAGPYYWYVFNAGKLFFTTDSASSSRTSSVFLTSYLEGKGDEETLRLMNREENINDYWQF
ncbi:MAG: hypothetical protein HYZ53_28425 [Planctomycetes bacterium]|nr:hypothetical protein [Planctomycetota bacterium]